MSPDESKKRLSSILANVQDYLDEYNPDLACFQLELEEAERILDGSELRPILDHDENHFDVIEALRNRVVVHTIMGGNQVALTGHERDSIVRAFDLLITALEPFARTRAPAKYANDLRVQVEITVTREMAQEWAAEWEMRSRAGNPPPWKKPDVERGMNYPVEVLNIDGIRIGDIRYAQSVLLSLQPIPQETANVAG